jgi:uncharacterized membrane protein
MSRNAAATLAYVLGPFTGVLVLILEHDPFVRFHSMQSIVVLGGLIVMHRLFDLTVVLRPMNQLLVLAYFILMLVFLYKSWHGEAWGVPFIDKYVRKLLLKTQK